jgi:peroxiredoxin
VCAYRDHFAELTALGGRVFGLSTQETAYQQEAADRLGIQYPLLSDERLELATALDLPRWIHLGTTLLKRQALLVRGGRIERVIYPVFPSDADAPLAVAWLRQTAASAAGPMG